MKIKKATSYIKIDILFRPLETGGFFVELIINTAGKAAWFAATRDLLPGKWIVLF
jgi:hypothetical protein